MIWNVKFLEWDLNDNHQNFGGLFLDVLLDNIADYSNVGSVVPYTPANISKLLISLLKPTENMSVYDPVSGSGGMLVQTLNRDLIVILLI
ncbi:N-6 DNA methylase [Citrobacter sp. Igbk 17]|uniref:N-6 DNA methylase n=1 Tax=Citrobacter sp. Igbk 17 TaxID=2963957 RepID=UPI003FA42A3C